MFVYFIRGVFIGLLFGLPAGAVGAMTVQRTWNHGVCAGLLTGFGSSVADCIYACIGAFGLTVVSDFLLKYQTVIHMAGGVLVLYMGICLLLGKGEGKAPHAVGEGERGSSFSFQMFLSSFAIGITNPAAIVTFLFAFSYFGISGQTTMPQGTGLVGGVFAGTYLWWTALSLGVGVLKRRKKADCFGKVNRIFGVILSGFGVAVFVRVVAGVFTG